MFTHVINNPNKFVIKDDYFVIPFGHRCTSALVTIFWRNISKNVQHECKFRFR